MGKRGLGRGRANILKECWRVGEAVIEIYSEPGL